MRGRLGEVTMVPDDFRSTDAVRFPASLDGLRKHFLDISRVLDAADVDFRSHSIRGAEMDAANTAQTLIEVLLERDVPDAVQLNLILAQIKAATLDGEFGLGQGVLRKGQRQRKIVWRLRSVQRIFSLSKSMPNSPFLRVDMV